MIKKLRRNLKNSLDQMETKSALDFSFIMQYPIERSLLFWADIFKDFVDTFKPYKTSQHRRRDLLQAFYGFKNLLLGIGWLVPSVFYNLFFALECKKNNLIDYHVIITYPLLGLFGSLTQIFRGATQMITAPLTLFRIPLRTYLSKNKKEWDVFQDKKSVKALIQEFDKQVDKKDINSVKKILNSLMLKADRNNRSGLYDYQFNQAPLNRRYCNDHGFVHFYYSYFDDANTYVDVERLSKKYKNKRFGNKKIIAAQEFRGFGTSMCWSPLTSSLQATIFDRTYPKNQQWDEISEMQSYVSLFRK